LFPEKCSELLSTVWSAWFTEVQSYQTGEYGIHKTFEIFTSIYVQTFSDFKDLLIMCFFSILARRLHQRADIVISGGGMVGASTAAAIAKLGRHPLPVEVWWELRLLLKCLFCF